MKPFAIFAVAVLLAPTTLAQHRTFTVNPGASEVKMTLKQPTRSSTAPFTSNPDRSSLTPALRRCRVR